jgi:hypothetical protein
VPIHMTKCVLERGCQREKFTVYFKALLCGLFGRRYVVYEILKASLYKSHQNCVS